MTTASLVSSFQTILISQIINSSQRTFHMPNKVFSKIFYCSLLNIAGTVKICDITSPVAVESLHIRHWWLFSRRQGQFSLVLSSTTQLLPTAIHTFDDTNKQLPLSAASSTEGICRRLLNPTSLDYGWVRSTCRICDLAVTSDCAKFRRTGSIGCNGVHPVQSILPFRCEQKFCSNSSALSLWSGWAGGVGWTHRIGYFPSVSDDSPNTPEVWCKRQKGGVLSFTED